MGDDWRNIPDITHLLWVRIAFLGCPTPNARELSEVFLLPPQDGYFFFWSEMRLERK